MSLDVWLTKKVSVYEWNITHNLVPMAEKAGIYEVLWHPETLGYTKAKHLIPRLTEGLAALKRDPESLRPFEPENGWGCYDDLVRFVESYLAACQSEPEAKIKVSP